MKRFLSLLTVFVLALALAVPVGAVGFDNQEFEYEGKLLTYNDGINLPDYKAVWTLGLNLPEYPHVFAYEVLPGQYYIFYCSNIVYGVSSSGLRTVVPSPMDYYFQYNANTNIVKGPTFVNAQELGYPINYYFWSLTDLHNEDGSVAIYGSDPTEPVCDGSTCPATDVNFDDICDDCGMTLAYNLRVTPNEFNIVVKHSEDMTLRYSFTETLAGTTFDAVYSDERITVSFDNAVNHKQYRMVDGEWVDHASYPNIYGSHAISLSGDASILSSDADIYDENGDLFFQNPLWMTVGMVTQGEVMGMSQTVAGVMKILTVCGVGCLALLTVLKLFGKRSLLFRG